MTNEERIKLLETQLQESNAALLSLRIHMADLLDIIDNMHKPEYAYFPLDEHGAHCDGYELVEMFQKKVGLYQEPES